MSEHELQPEKEIDASISNTETSENTLGYQQDKTESDVNPGKDQQSDETSVSGSQALQLIRERWPDVFRIAKPKPLKVGIHKEMQLDCDIDTGVIRKALKLYTQQDRYLLTIKDGTPRTGLDGKPAGHVKLSEAVNAEILLYKRHTARENRNRRVFVGQLKWVPPAIKTDDKQTTEDT